LSSLIDGTVSISGQLENLRNLLGTIVSDSTLSGFFEVGLLRGVVDGNLALDGILRMDMDIVGSIPALGHLIARPTMIVDVRHILTRPMYIKQLATFLNYISTSNVYNRYVTTDKNSIRTLEE